MKRKPAKRVSKADIVRALRHLAGAMRNQARELQQLREQLQHKGTH